MHARRPVYQRRASGSEKEVGEQKRTSGAGTSSMLAPKSKRSKNVVAVRARAALVAGSCRVWSGSNKPRHMRRVVRVVVSLVLAAQQLRREHVRECLAQR
jgi:hypothetical protein